MFRMSGSRFRSFLSFVPNKFLRALPFQHVATKRCILTNNKPKYYHLLLNWCARVKGTIPSPLGKLTRRVLPYTPLARGFCSTTPALEAPPKQLKTAAIETTKTVTSNIQPASNSDGRIKKFLFKTTRPWTLDDIFAMFSWVLLSNSFFILAGTTTFFSLLLGLANSLEFHEFVKNGLGKILTQELGMVVNFESAIVPNWKDGRISLKNVRIQYNVPNPQDKAEQVENPSIWDLRIDCIDITLSLVRFLDGKGIVKDCSMKGVRGIIDRSRVTYPADATYNYDEIREAHRFGDFELESFRIEDLLVTFCHPYGFRPFQISIFNAHLPLLRKRWFLYDMIGADSIVGMFDNCLFSVHISQNFPCPLDSTNVLPFRRSHFRVDGVPIDQFNSGMEGPFGWISSGTVDFDIDITIPNCSEMDLVQKFATEIKIKFDEALLNRLGSLSEEFPQKFPSLAELLAPIMEKAKSATNDSIRVQKRLDSVHMLDSLVFDIDVRFHNIRTGIPIRTGEFTLASQTVIRPVIAYMNSNRTCIPVHCRVVSSLVSVLHNSSNLGRKTLMEHGQSTIVSLL
ncbi:Mitochondrial distribution and morphology protein 31, mitochondrial precursor, variant 2 [Entomophthora muscae]|uniref:Mitochondrial distribution and morphology protein 31, mitochondrial, variant 2 n=1 Tax=Entomophthora muscae TaxID=34485 RepID=A0ACC2TZ55_9FUNG|nr:Mitochondrial distribution and morphology protein 31, mitochondrial precursor, variant 2 [Entomophthora muscae]